MITSRLRRHSGHLLAALGLLLALPSEAAAARPNFVVILCDDLGYGDLACFGHPTIRTPHLDQLAREGMRLTACYSAAPVCSPSRVGLLTGRSPNRSGVYDWIPPGRQARPDAREQVHLRGTEVTLPRLLQQAGYATCLSGKYHGNSQFNQPQQAQPGDLGFDHWFATQNNASPSHHNPNNFVRNGNPVGALEGYSCQIAVDESLRWLERQERGADEQPFFLMLTFHEPHEPIASPKAIVEQYRKTTQTVEEAEYFANVTNLDQAVGRLVAALDYWNELDDTLLFFTSDNGPETLRRYPGAARSYGRATPLKGMKLWTTEAGFRVPGILYWRGQVPANSVSDTPVSSLDLLPTFCALASIKPPAIGLDGTDISPLWTQQSFNRPQPLFWCFFNALNGWQVAMRTDDWKVLGRLDSGRLPKFQNIHDGNLAAVQAAQIGNLELYDAHADISETHNLAAKNPAKAAELRQQMQLLYQELTRSSHYWERSTN